MTGTVHTHERGCAGGAQPPLNCLTHLNAAFHCKDQAAISEMVEQEQWAAEGVQPQLNRSHYIRYNFNAGCSAGSAPFFAIRRITPYLFFFVLVLQAVSVQRSLMASIIKVQTLSLLRHKHRHTHTHAYIHKHTHTHTHAHTHTHKHTHTQHVHTHTHAHAPACSFALQVDFIQRSLLAGIIRVTTVRDTSG